MNLLERYGEAEMRRNAPLELFVLPDGTAVSVRIRQIPEADEWCKAARAVLQKEKVIARLMRKVDAAQKDRDRAEQRRSNVARKHEQAMEGDDDAAIDEARRAIALRDTWLDEAEAAVENAEASLQTARDGYHAAMRECLCSYAPELAAEELAKHGGITFAQSAKAFTDLFTLTDPTQAGQYAQLQNMLGLTTLSRKIQTTQTAPNTDTTPSPSS